MPVAERLAAKVDRSAGPDACWPFTGSTNEHGYGRIGLRHPHVALAHRVAFELAVGPIPAGMIVRHRCDTPPCCNPAHLELGTQADNMADMDARGRRRVSRGEGHGKARTTASQVAAIRSAAAAGVLRAQIADDHDMPLSRVVDIVLRRTWRHVA